MSLRINTSPSSGKYSKARLRTSLMLIMEAVKQENLKVRLIGKHGFTDQDLLQSNKTSPPSDSMSLRRWLWPTSTVGAIRLQQTTETTWITLSSTATYASSS